MNIHERFVLVTSLNEILDDEALWATYESRKIKKTRTVTPTVKEGATTASWPCFGSNSSLDL